MKPTLEILHSIHQRLVKRHHLRGDRGLVAVGMGWPMKNGEPDRERGLELVYLVKKIKKRPLAHHKIPDVVRVYLAKGKGKRRKRYLARFTRHIMEMPKGVQLTGFSLMSGKEEFTGGALIRWPDGNGGQAWGLLTIGHGAVTEKVS